MTLEEGDNILSQKIQQYLEGTEDAQGLKAHPTIKIKNQNEWGLWWNIQGTNSELCI